jgi:2,4-dienoyl-CoA reductase-like NADH-dependent reductase (Old Yellow Enzyme family)
MPAAISPPPFTPLKDSLAFKPWTLRSIRLKHRIVQAPLTRMRAVKEIEGVYVPGELAVEYYRQRASDGGLQLTEATDIALYASGYPGVPGIFSPSQIEGWKKVTDAVHAKHGHIICQLWHTGRASPPSFRAGQRAPSASDIPISGKALDETDYAANPPKEATVEEIKQITADFASAGLKAIEAGFDGVEIHGMLKN